MNIQEFINKYNGTNQDFDNGYGSQCVDLARLAVENLWGMQSNVVYPTNPPVGGAVHAYTDFPNSLINGNKNVKRIENSIDNCPVAGDIIIWNRNRGGGNGHIALVTEANINSFTVFEQNNGNGDGYGKDDACKVTQYADYTDVLGWLHCTKFEGDLMSKAGEAVSNSFDGSLQVAINNKRFEQSPFKDNPVLTNAFLGSHDIDYIAGEMISRDKTSNEYFESGHNAWGVVDKCNTDYQILTDKYNILKADKASLQAEKDEAQKQHIESLKVSANNLNQCNNQNANLSNTNKNLEVGLAKAPTSTSKPFWMSKKFISTIVLGLIPQIIGFLNPDWRESANQLYSVLVAYLVAQGIVDTTQTLIKK
jgi:CHAP domain